MRNYEKITRIWYYNNDKITMIITIIQIYNNNTNIYCYKNIYFIQKYIKHTQII